MLVNTWETSLQLPFLSAFVISHKKFNAVVDACAEISVNLARDVKVVQIVALVENQLLSLSSHNGLPHGITLCDTHHRYFACQKETALIGTFGSQSTYKFSQNDISWLMPIGSSEILKICLRRIFGANLFNSFALYICLRSTIVYDPVFVEVETSAYDWQSWCLARQFQTMQFCPTPRVCTYQAKVIVTACLYLSQRE